MQTCVYIKTNEFTRVSEAQQEVQGVKLATIVNGNGRCCRGNAWLDRLCPWAEDDLWQRGVSLPTRGEIVIKTVSWLARGAHVRSTHGDLAMLGNSTQ